VFFCLSAIDQFFILVEILRGIIVNNRLLYLILEIIAAAGVMFILPALIAFYAIAFGVGGY